MASCSGPRVMPIVNTFRGSLLSNGTLYISSCALLRYLQGVDIPTYGCYSSSGPISQFPLDLGLLGGGYVAPACPLLASLYLSSPMSCWEF
ncbi:hypothetical protein LIER_33065 [Lithospermum erythrorhizon]|uniref:Uncharacterized protein n=1 Tax=Lithospermum erythrorhizon TaxID=34254 RepID=A0AAV3RZP0_LITER